MKPCECCGAGQTYRIERPTWGAGSPATDDTDGFCSVEFVPCHQPHHPDCTLNPALLAAQDRAAKARLCAPNPAMRPYLTPPRPDPGFPQVGGLNEYGRGGEKVHERLIKQIHKPNPAMKRLLASIR